MSEERRKVLQMLSSGQVSADEAERLLDAMERQPAVATASVAVATPPRYLRVEVNQQGGEDGPVMVNVRVPIQLLRAGVKLASVIPPKAQEHVNQALADQGIPFDLGRLRPEDLDELVLHLQDLTIDVDQQGDKEKVKVRVYCE